MMKVYQKIYNSRNFMKLLNFVGVLKPRLLNDPKLKGYNASKSRFFYGFKVHMSVTTLKEPVGLFISDGSVHDVKVAYPLLSSLPKSSTAIGDKGYVSSALESFLKQLGIHLSAIGRKNMKQDAEYQTKRRIQKGVETAFSVITAKFGKVIKATSIGGFLTKLKLFITAYSIDMFLKLPQVKQKLAFN